jgi:ribonuclease HII
MSSKSTWTNMELINDDESDKEILELLNKNNVNNNHIALDESSIIVEKKKKGRPKKQLIESENKLDINNNIEFIVEPTSKLKTCFTDNLNIIEIGVDEAGRGPMFGRVYAGAAVLPKNETSDFKHYLMKDSKKFGKTKKGYKDICETSDYIKSSAIAWSVQYEDEDIIDKINILQATQSAMHKCIKDILHKLANKKDLQPAFSLENTLLLIDGNYFKPYMYLNKTKDKLETIRYQMVEQGDNTYTSIAAASILAKVERDKYIDTLCAENPELSERYGIDSNKGYGAKKHIEGIKKYGITKWHRKSFGICKEYC